LALLGDDLLGLLRSRTDEMMEDLMGLLRVDSFTYSPEGVNEVTSWAERRLVGLGFSTERHPQGDGRFALVARWGKGLNPAVLVLAHSDMAQRVPKGKDPELLGGRLVFPGVSDMKASLVSMVYALEALIREGAMPGELVVVVSPDEEQGSPATRGLIEREALRAKVCLGVEAARPDGSIVLRRKGAAYFELRVYGKSSHSGSQYGSGASAILELSRKIPLIFSLTDETKGLTANVGYVRGGEELGNALAGFAEAKVDLKFWDMEQGVEAVEALKRICSAAEDSRVRIELSGGVAFPPMVETPGSTRLAEAISEAAEGIGIKGLKAVATGGEADVGYASSMGVPCVDGLGPVGGGHHTPEEYLEVGSLPVRTALLARAVALSDELF